MLGSSAAFPVHMATYMSSDLLQVGHIYVPENTYVGYEVYACMYVRSYVCTVHGRIWVRT